MKNLKKKALMAGSLVAATAIAVGGTLAYANLSYDDEGALNTYTVGEAVDIAINEYQRNEDGSALEAFEQGKELLPIIGSAQAASKDKNGNDTTDENDNMDKWGMPEAENYGDKIVTIKNTGDVPAYIRVFVAKPMALADLAGDGSGNTSDDPLHTNLGNRVNLDGNYSKDNYSFDNWGWEYNVEVFEAEIDGQKYEVATNILKNPLAVGDESTAVMAGAYLDSKVDYDDGIWTMGDYIINYDLSKGVHIPVYAEAVAESEFTAFEDAETVFAKWADTVKAPELIEATDKGTLTEALASSGDAIIDMGGETLDLNAAFTKANVAAGETVTVKNATINARSYGNKIDGTVVFENCTFENEAGAYSIHFDGGNGNVIFNNCTLNGWCSFGSLSRVELNSCNIGGNGTYAMIRFYQPAVLNNCTIDGTNAVSTDDWFEGVSAVDGAVVTLNECEVTNAGYQADAESDIIVIKDGAEVEITIADVE